MKHVIVINRVARGCAMAFAFGLFSSLSWASTALVTNRTALAGTDFINWGILGPDPTLVSNPFNILSNGGVNVTVSKALPGDFELVDQGSSWNGNFNPGDHLLWVIGNIFSTTDNPIAIMNFGGAGVLAGGAQIQADFYGNFTAKIEAFDVNNNSLGAYTENGISNGDANNSAIFIGINSTTPISTLKLSITGAYAGTIGDYAINRLDFTSAAKKVYVDVQPGGCPNTFNLKKMGVLPVAILGTTDLNVQDIDVGSITIKGIAPLSASIADVGTPFVGPLSDCNACNHQGRDRIPDLVLQFNAQAIAASLGSLTSGTCTKLTINGKLKDGTYFQGEDVISITNK